MAREAPPRNPLESLLGYQLRRVSAALMAALGRDLDAIGLRPAEASILMLIGANPGITQSELGRELGIQRANMAPLAGSLERRLLIARTPLNGRSHGLVLTEAGTRLRAEVEATMQAHELAIEQSLAAPAREELRVTLGSLWRDLREGESTSGSAILPSDER